MHSQPFPELCSLSRSLVLRHTHETDIFAASCEEGSIQRTGGKVHC